MTETSRRKLKLLFMSSDKFPPFRVDVSILFGKEMVGRGHKIDLLLQAEESTRHSYQTRWSGCIVWVGPTDMGTSFLSRLRKHFYSISHDFKMFKRLRAEKYDFVIVKDKFITGLFAIVASALFGSKFIYWLSYPFPEYYLNEYEEGRARYPFLYWIRGHIFRILLYHILLPLSDHAFVQTEYMRRTIASYGIPKEKMTAVPMAVSMEDIPYFGYDEKGYDGVQEKKVVYLGTLFKARRIDFLIRVFEKVLRRQKNAKLYLVGGGDDDHRDEQEIEHEANKLGIEDNVTITGFLPQQEAWDFCKNAHVCVSPIFPSPILDCGSPTKLIEYMAMGKAAVANDHPEQRLVISESKAGICVPYEEDVFAEAILYLLRNPKKAKEMGIRGRAYVRKKRNYDQLATLVEAKLQALSGNQNTVE